MALLFRRASGIASAAIDGIDTMNSRLISFAKPEYHRMNPTKSNALRSLDTLTKRYVQNVGV